MADIKYPGGNLDAGNWQRFLGANRTAHISADYDSGWQPTSQGKTVTHNLGQVPSEVWVYSSEQPDGAGFQPDTYTNANRTQITVNGAQSYFRVRINKGRIDQSSGV